MRKISRAASVGQRRSRLGERVIRGGGREGTDTVSYVQALGILTPHWTLTLEYYTTVMNLPLRIKLCCAIVNLVSHSQILAQRGLEYGRTVQLASIIFVTCSYKNMPWPLHGMEPNVERATMYVISTASM